MGEDPRSETVEDPPLLYTSDFEGWAWGFGDYSRSEIQGLEYSTRYLLRILQTEGPFVGIVGFSTGATMAMILVTLVERGAPPEVMKAFQLNASVSSIVWHAMALKAQDSHFSVQVLPPSFKFAIISSGVTLSHPRYKQFYYPEIQTPVLHFIEEFDTHIPNTDMLRLSRVCKNCTTVRHPGAHFMPRYRHCQLAMSKFIIEHLRK
jgi:dienelactone hydrolase